MKLSFHRRARMIQSIFFIDGGTGLVGDVGLLRIYGQLRSVVGSGCRLSSKTSGPSRQVPPYSTSP